MIILMFTFIYCTCFSLNSSLMQESLVIDTPRVRKQTRHYNSFEDDELMEFSELDSDSEERPCRTRRLGERSRRYLRAECFRVEKNLLIFGYLRILANHLTFSKNRERTLTGLFVQLTAQAYYYFIKLSNICM